MFLILQKQALQFEKTGDLCNYKVHAVVSGISVSQQYTVAFEVPYRTTCNSFKYLLDYLSSPHDLEHVINAH